jgi:hypothetical protein
VGCSPTRTTTVWKNEHAFPGKYNKIMIAAVVDNNDTALRAKVENGFQTLLQSIGYPAVSSLKEFGVNGLRDLDQEDTYRSLCDNGIDAVMTLALIDRTDENYKEPASSYTQPVKYYYERMWHYKERQEKSSEAFYDSTKKYSWEMILFDLSTLQPHSIVQSKIFTNGIRESISHEFWKDIIKRLTKDRYLKKRAPVTEAPPEGPKAF